MIVKENVNQNSLSIMKNTAIFQIILKIKQKNYSNMDGNHIRNLKNDFNELLSLNISYESIRKITYFLVIHIEQRPSKPCVGGSNPSGLTMTDFSLTFKHSAFGNRPFTLADHWLSLKITEFSVS